MFLDDSEHDESSDEEAAERTFSTRFSGHRNRDTVKGITFMGEESQWVVSGSDCGNVFIWDAHTGELIQCVECDMYVFLNARK